MGHSFGCIVVSATVAGPAGEPDLPRPVDSLFLVQGALSLWSYASDIPYAAGRRATSIASSSTGSCAARSSRRARRTTPPSAASIRSARRSGSSSSSATSCRRTAASARSASRARGRRGHGDGRGELRRTTSSPGRSTTSRRADIIKNGGGASGAHSDIAHPEVAHAFWAAALAAPLPPTGTLSPGGGSAAAPRPAGCSAAASSARRRPRRARGAAAASRRSSRSRPRKTSCRCGRSGIAIALRSEAGARRARRSRRLRRRSDRSMSRSRIRPPTRSSQAGELVHAGLRRRRRPARRRAGRGAASPTSRSFPQGVDETAVTVQLDSADFDIPDPIRPLRVPRSGKSRNKARFEISPLHDGASSLTATLHKDGNFLQSIAITFVVGGTRAGRRSRRRRAAGRPRPRARCGRATSA